MKRELVQSSNIASIGYDAVRQILEVQFKGGLLWQYSEVAPEEHRALMSAPSIGSHFMKHIRGRKEGGPVVEVRPPAAAFEDCAKAVEEYQDAAFADRYRQSLSQKRRLAAQGAEFVPFERTPAIPVLRHPDANSWYRVQLAVYPRTCPACGRAVAAVWQDHHLAHPVQTGWVVGWVCQATLDGRDCSRFVFIHTEECPGTESIFVGSGMWPIVTQEGCRHGFMGPHHDEISPCEIIFNCQKTRALGVGDICAQVLAAKRAIAPKGIE